MFVVFHWHLILVPKCTRTKYLDICWLPCPAVQQRATDWSMWVQLCSAITEESLAEFWGVRVGERPLEDTFILNKVSVNAKYAAEPSQTQKTANCVLWSETELGDKGQFESMKEAHISFLKVGWRTFGTKNCVLGPDPAFKTSPWVNKEGTVARRLGEVYRCAVVCVHECISVWIHIYPAVYAQYIYLRVYIIFICLSVSQSVYMAGISVLCVSD